jgi:transcriptional regulator GlxA family with amidase domain
MRRLAHVDDWLARAAEARYSSRHLAVLCAVTDRHFRRRFVEWTGRSAQAWLDEMRLW